MNVCERLTLFDIFVRFFFQGATLTITLFLFFDLFFFKFFAKERITDLLFLLLSFFFFLQYFHENWHVQEVKIVRVIGIGIIFS